MGELMFILSSNLFYCLSFLCSHYDGYDDLSPQAHRNELDDQLAALNQLNLNEYEQHQESGEHHQNQQEEEEIKYSHDQQSSHPQEYNDHYAESPEPYTHDMQPPLSSLSAELFDHDQDQDEQQPPPPPTEEEEEPYGQAYRQEQQMEGEGEEPNELETLQLQREREFMAYLCDGLDQQVPPEYAEHIEADLSERLRQTVSDEH